MNEVQERISQLRENGWTLAALADELGFHAFTVRRWQDGVRSPNGLNLVVDSLRRLANDAPPPKRRFDGQHWKQREFDAFNATAGEGMKRCRGCSLVIPMEDFDRDKSRHDGLYTRCKSCRDEQQRQPPVAV